jgi:hypothetical protein
LSEEEYKSEKMPISDLDKIIYNSRTY